MSTFSNINISIGKTINTVNTIADLRNYKPRSIHDGDTVIVSAGAILGDAHGGAFVWVEGSTVADDGGDTIKPVFAVGSGRWVKAFGSGPQGVRGEQGLRGEQGEASIVPGPQGEGLATVMAPMGSALVGFKTTPSTAIARSVLDKTRELEFSPEDFGAKGDGIADDAPAIQAALDAIKARIVNLAPASATDKQPKATMGTLRFTGGKRYKMGAGIVMDRAYHNIVGHAVLDFSTIDGVYILVDGSYTEFGNGYGTNGSIDGSIVIKGSRTFDPNTGAVTREGGVGIKFHSENNFSCTHIRTIGVNIGNCGVGFQFGSRGYNQELINCKVFSSGVCLDWLQADDNDERISVFGGTYYNSTTFVRHKRLAGGLYVYSASVDYVKKIAELEGGKMQWFGTHTESNQYEDGCVTLSGDGAHFAMHGGWFLQQSNILNLVNFFNIGENCTVKLFDVITNNTNNIAKTNPTAPTTWARGLGSLEMHNTTPGFEFGGFPERLHERYSVLSDGDFEAAALGQDQLWVEADTQPLTSRFTGQNIQLSRATTNQLAGAGCLRIDKQFGLTSTGSVILACIPVRFGDNVTGGYRIRTAPDRPGTDSSVVFTCGFAKIDGFKVEGGSPKIVRYDTFGDQNFAPPQTYQLRGTGNRLSTSKAPSWATHYIMKLDLVLAHQASWNVDGIWLDRF